MKQNKPNQIFFFIAGILISILTLTFISLSIRSFPISKVENPYPGPYDITPSAFLTICDQWFSYFDQLPPEKRSIAEQQYKKCIEALLTPTAPNAEKDLPAIAGTSGDSVSFFRRLSGDGSILETSYSPLPSYLSITNQWHANLDGTMITAYAGAQRNEPGSGQPLTKPLPGVIVVQVSGPDRSYLPEQSGYFYTPANSGSLRIVDAQGTDLILLAEDETIYVFDVVSRQFLSSVFITPWERASGAGKIVETHLSPIEIEGYSFVNYWKADNATGNFVVLAGGSKNDPKQGVIVLAHSSPLDDSSFLSEDLFMVPLDGGALRIADAQEYTLTIVSEAGLIYTFDVLQKSFLSLPGGLPGFVESYSLMDRSGIPTKTPTRTLTVTLTSTSSSGGAPTRTITCTPTVTRTATPTRTSTPRPSSTALPTYDPYP